MRVLLLNRDENIVAKGEIFPQCFQKSSAVDASASGKGLMIIYNDQHDCAIAPVTCYLQILS